MTGQFSAVCCGFTSNLSVCAVLSCDDLQVHEFLRRPVLILFHFFIYLFQYLSCEYVWCLSLYKCIDF